MAKKKAGKKKTSKKLTKKKKVAKKKVTKKKATKKTAAKKATSKKAKSKKTTKKKTSSKSRPTPPQVKVGEKVPDFALEGTGGTKFHLTDRVGQVTVIYFYPKDATPGCTLEGQDFTNLHNEFKRSQAEVFGISRDSIKSHENFRAKQGYSFDLLSDPNEEACKIFGVIKEKNMYGRKVLGIERSTFVIDKDGRLAKEWRAVKVPGHAAEVLDFVKTL